MSDQYWDRIFSSEAIATPGYDDWLEKRRAVWEHARNIVDLGCGSGTNSFFLHRCGIRTIACDFSKEALRRVTEALPDARVMRLDMAEGLPFPNSFSDLIIADLSLHYFKRQITFNILRELLRVLSVSGHLLCRVNAVREFEENGNRERSREMEHHLYETPEGTKRFFDLEDIHMFFAEWDVLDIAETEITKYGRVKYAWEVCARNPG